MTEGAAESKAFDTVEIGPPVVTWLGSSTTPPPPPKLSPLELVVGFNGDPPASALLPEVKGLGVVASGRGGDVVVALEEGEGPMKLVLMTVGGAVGHD